MTELVWEGKYGADGKRPEPSRAALPLQTVETIGAERGSRDGRSADGWSNRLMRGDKKDVLPAILPTFAGQVDLIYVDPPFDTGTAFSASRRVPSVENAPQGEPLVIEQAAYRDTWGRGLDRYLQWFYETVVLLRELLADTGSIYVHLDWRLDGFARAIMDEVFGPACFRNAIVWKRDVAGKGAKRVSRQWPRNADTILYYSKSPTTWTFTQPFVELNEAQQKAYRYVDPDGRRYKAVQLGDYSAASIARFEAQGLIHTSRSTRTKYKKYYLDEALATVDGIWSDILGFGTRTAAAEQSGYPTQKPEALLERIIKASSREGDLVLDCFCGSGTTAVVAAKLGRRWIAADLGRLAVQTTRKRLLSIDGVRPFVVQNLGQEERPVGAAVSLDVSQDGSTITLALRDFVVPRHDVPADVQAAITHWSQWIDEWAVDWDYRGDTFDNRWHSYRTRQNPALQCRASHSYDLPGSYTVAVKAVDILANETTTCVTIDVP